MKKTIYFNVVLLAFLTISLLGQAQNNNQISQKLFGQDLTPDNQTSIQETNLIRCGFVEYEQYLQERHPGRATLQEFETWMAVKKEQIQAQRTNNPNDVQTIPVIFHIFTDGTGNENLSAALIQAQIDQLNIDYRNLAGSSHAQADDAMIEFCLAVQAEDGSTLVENGINRVTTYGEGPFTTNDFENGMKTATQWDPTQYFNVWVANISGGVLGYAQFPDYSSLPGLPPVGGSGDTDGVVVSYASVGSIANPNPFGAPYANGRTLSHEAGHWLGLRHIWGDTSSCSNDDFCADTPDATTSNSGCPTVDSCPFDNLGNDMVENYMDYTFDTCLNTFTADQVSRMQTVLANSPRRVELLSSTVCQPAVNLDGKIGINSLNKNNCNGTVTPEIVLTNRGLNQLTSATIHYYLNNDTPLTYNWAGSLGFNQSDTFSLPILSGLVNTNVFNIEIISINSSTDLNSNNDFASEEFTILSYATGSNIVLNLQPDYWGTEITWKLVDENNVVLDSGGPYQDGTYNAFTGYTLDALDTRTWSSLSEGCYTFTIYDSWGDGICNYASIGDGAPEADGYYSLSSDGIEFAQGCNFGDLNADGSFSVSESVSFKISSLGTIDFDLGNSISIYPNPATDILNIKTNNNISPPDGYTIYNVLGQVVSEKDLKSNHDLTINISDYSNGMYFIKISSETASVTLPFIKK